MSYSAGEALVLSTLRLHANYDTDNTSRGDWEILSSGRNSYYVILRPGPFTISTQGISGVGSGSGNTREAMWLTQLMIYQLYGAEQATNASTNLQDRADEIIAHLDKYRRMGDATNTIPKARITSGSEIELVNQQGSLWARWIVNVEWKEERPVTYAE